MLDGLTFFEGFGNVSSNMRKMTECQLMRMVLVPDVTISYSLLESYRTLNESIQDSDKSRAVNNITNNEVIPSNAWRIAVHLSVQLKLNTWL